MISIRINVVFPVITAMCEFQVRISIRWVGKIGFAGS